MQAIVTLSRLKGNESFILELFGLEPNLIWAYKSLIGVIHPSLYAYVVGANKELIKLNGLGLDMFRLHLVMSVFKLRCGTHLHV